MKLVLDLINEPKKDCVIIYNGKEWVCVNKNVFLNEINDNYKKLNEKYEETTKYINHYVKATNEKLKEYHNILKLITKEK